MQTAKQKSQTPPTLAKRIDLAKRRVAYLERLAEAKQDVKAGRVSEFKMEDFFPNSRKNASRKN